MRHQGQMKHLAAAAIAFLAGGAAGAQLLPPIVNPAPVLDDVGRTTAEALDGATGIAGRAIAEARTLARARTERLQDLVDAHSDLLEMTPAGPAVRGQIIALDPSDETLAAVQAAGYRIVADEAIEGLELRSVILEVRSGLSLRAALRQLRRIAPSGEFAANHLHGQSGTVLSAAAAAGLPLAAQAGGSGLPLGIIDGGVAAHPTLPGPIEQRGFARGGPAPNAHGTAVASLAAGRGAVRGAAPGARLLVADIYGRDPAGGNSLALAKALGWMVQRRVPIVVISLVGPNNALVQRAVNQARARGVQLFAAIGNDGPAAPPAYPASYDGVIAITGVDRRNRVLLEAGRALHLDYAAPGADMAAASLGGDVTRVRGTSFAVPFVAARAWRAVSAGRTPIAALDAEAVDLPPRGPDRRSGRGLVCGGCRTPL
jgi:minor extracellular protease Epr